MVLFSGPVIRLGKIEFHEHVSLLGSLVQLYDRSQYLVANETFFSDALGN
jgi:hypothetical protein